MLGDKAWLIVAVLAHPKGVQIAHIRLAPTTCSQTQIYLLSSLVHLHLSTNRFLQHCAGTSLTSAATWTQTTHKVTSL